LVLQAFNACKPGIPPKLSLLNALYELKDFKSLPRTIAKMKGIAPKGKLSLRRILKASADVNLQWQFNVRSLLQDIINLENALVQTRSMIQKIIDDAGGKQMKRIAYDLRNVYKDSNTTSANIGYGTQGGFSQPDEIAGACRAHRIVTYTSAVFKAQLEYEYTLPAGREIILFINGYLDALGVNLNPQIIWNAIPWSFVIDWVIGVNRWLGNLKQTNLGLKTVIHRWCWSVDVSRIIKTYKTVGSDNLYYKHAMIPVIEVTESAYKRDTAAPNIYGALTASGLSLNEIGLGASLSVSRL
jgi:hypothetical protein